MRNNREKKDEKTDGQQTNNHKICRNTDLSKSIVLTAKLSFQVFLKQIVVNRIYLSPWTAVWMVCKTIWPA